MTGDSGSQTPAGPVTRVLVTGATGLVGTSVVARLRQAGLEVVAGTRDGGSSVPAAVPSVCLGDLSDYHDRMDLPSVDAVVHLAARVHEMQQVDDDLDAYLAANTRATQMLARSALRCGVRRLVFLSTVKVNGESTLRHRPFRADDLPQPQGPYALSKAMAEDLLLSEEFAPSLEVVIIRSPLVYGAGATANFARLMRVANTPIPMPTGLDENRRSLIAVENLAHAVEVVLRAPEAAGRIYLVRDGVDVSTADLVRRMRRVRGHHIPSVPIPAGILRVAAGIVKGQQTSSRLLESLTVDDTPIRRDLGWRPVQTVDQGLEAAFGCPSRPRRLLFFVTEDWYFWSHRRNIALAARQRGWEVHVACHVDAHADRIRAAGMILHPLDLDRGGRAALAEARALGQLRDIVKAVHPDVLHNVAMKPVIYGSLVGSMTGVPVVINALAGLGSAFTRESTTLLGWALTRALRQAMGEQRQWLIAQNADDADFALSHGLVTADRLRIIPGSGVDLEEFPYSPPPRSGRVTATVVSRMLWDKGIAETVEAARILRHAGVPVDVELVGDSDPHNPRSIPSAQLAAWQDEGLVRWLGRREDIPVIWAASDIAVLASYREGMPKSLLEAASVGRPLVACDVPGSRELVQEGVNGLLVPPRDAKALAAAIAQLVADGQARMTMGRCARQRVQERYATDLVVAAHLRLYDFASGLS